jgi:RNA polymerase sigma factor (sigma-70 family)
LTIYSFICLVTLNENKKISNLEDVETVNRILNGDSEAFAILQKKYKRIIASLIRRMIKDEDDVMDLTQDTFIKTYNGLSKYQSSYSFSSWLFKIASNTCIDFLRKKRFGFVSISQGYGDSEDGGELEIKDDSYIPDMNVLTSERRKVLLEAIEQLPDNYKKIIKMRHGEELDYSEISEKLGIPLGTVKAHLFRARKILYDQLKNHKYLFND